MPLQWKHLGSTSALREKLFELTLREGGGAPTGVYGQAPPPGAGLDRDPAETQPVKTYGISKVKSRCTDPVTENHGVGGSIPPLGTNKRQSRELLLVLR